jgi:uncharacterized protein YjbI with pentapeptide repeats
MRWRRVRRIVIWTGWGKVAKAVATIAVMATALATIGALHTTNQTLETNRDQVANVQAQNKLAEQSQFADRYAKAVEQLGEAGTDHLQVRLGAIYSFEWLARDYLRGQPTIIEILSDFIRAHTPVPTNLEPPRVGWTLPVDRSIACPDQAPTPDIQAALTVLGRRNTGHDDNIRVDVHGACLNGVDLSGAHLNNANLSGAHLNNANLRDAELDRANLTRVYLGDANLDSAHLNGVNLTEAYLTGAKLEYASLDGASLGDAHLRRADFEHAHLNAIFDGADLGEAYLGSAYLNGAQLNGTKLDGANFLDADLSDATFGGINLSNAVLSGAQLDRTYLRDADLHGAYLDGAHLEATDLRGADLRGTKHDDATVVLGAITDSKTLAKWW